MTLVSYFFIMVSNDIFDILSLAYVTSSGGARGEALCVAAWLKLHFPTIFPYTF